MSARLSDVEALAAKWMGASAAARRLEHHWPADCLAEAAVAVEHLAARLAEAEQAAEQRGRDEAVAEVDYHAARASALKAKHENGSGGWWAEWHRRHCAAAEAAHRAEAALAGLLGDLTEQADEWETAHGDPPVDPSHISVRHARALRAIVARHREDGNS